MGSELLPKEPSLDETTEGAFLDFFFFFFLDALALHLADAEGLEEDTEGLEEDMEGLAEDAGALEDPEALLFGLEDHLEVEWVP